MYITIFIDCGGTGIVFLYVFNLREIQLITLIITDTVSIYTKRQALG